MRAVTAAAVFAALGVVAAISFAHGSYFDDEIYSLELFSWAKSTLSIVRVANSFDVHPPLGYVLLWWIHALVGDWQAVKLVVGLLSAAGAAVLAFCAGSALRPRATIILGTLLAASATIVMWGESLRWYGLFNPFYWVVAGYVLFVSRTLGRSALAVALGGVILFHINYVAVIALPPVALAAAFRHRRAPRQEWVRSALFVALGAAACLPQFWILVSVHLHHPGQQAGSIALTLGQTALTLLAGTASLSGATLPAMIAAAITLGWLAAKLVRSRQGIDSRILAVAAAIIVCAAGMILSGVGYKARNSVFLLPMVTVLVAFALDRMERPAVRWALLALIMLNGLLGMRNVALHDGTAKRSFNIPYPLAVEQIRRTGAGCRALVVVNRDAVLAYLLQRDGVQQQSPYAYPYAPVVMPAGGCLINVTGFDGPISDVWLARWNAAFGALPLKRVRRWSIGHDATAQLKAGLSGQTVPDTLLDMELYMVPPGTTIDLPVSAPDILSRSN